MAIVGNTNFVDRGVNVKLYETAHVTVIASIGVVDDCFFQRNYAPINRGPRLGPVAIAQHVAIGMEKWRLTLSSSA